MSDPRTLLDKSQQHSQDANAAPAFGPLRENYPQLLLLQSIAEALQALAEIQLAAVANPAPAVLQEAAPNPTQATVILPLELTVDVLTTWLEKQSGATGPRDYLQEEPGA